MKAAGGEGGFRDPETEKFPYEKIKNGEIDNLNQNCKEMYLNDDEFQQARGARARVSRPRCRAPGRAVGQRVAAAAGAGHAPRGVLQAAAVEEAQPAAGEEPLLRRRASLADSTRPSRAGSSRGLAPPTCARKVRRA